MTTAPKALLAEDEPVLRTELRELLAKLWPELAICAEAEDGIEAIRAFEQHAPDIVFLDIQMPGMTGLEVAQQLGAKVHVVFVTAYDKFALTAFEQGAVDYVLKPFSVARLMTTVGRLKQKVKSAPANLDGFLHSLAQAAAPREYMRWITPSSATGNIRIGTEIAEGRLRLRIADTGAGFVPEKGEGSIRDIRERLQALYGGNGRLDLRRQEAGSTEAVLDLPLEAAEDVDASATGSTPAYRPVSEHGRS